MELIKIQCHIDVKVGQIKSKKRYRICSMYEIFLVITLYKFKIINAQLHTVEQLFQYAPKTIWALFSNRWFYNPHFLFAPPPSPNAFTFLLFEFNSVAWNNANLFLNLCCCHGAFRHFLVSGTVDIKLVTANIIV